MRDLDPPLFAPATTVRRLRTLLGALLAVASLAAYAHQGETHAPAREPAAASSASQVLSGHLAAITVIDRVEGYTRRYPMLELAGGGRYRLTNAGVAATGAWVNVQGRLEGRTLVVDTITSATATGPAPRAAAARGELTGTIRVFHIDYPDGTSEFGYTLAGDSGRRNVIDLGTPLPGIENGARATISGPVDARGYISVDTIEILAPPEAPALKPKAALNAGATAVTTQYAVAPLIFPNNAAAPFTYNADPFTIASITSNVFGTLPTKSAAEYYKEVSFGAQLLAGSVLNASNAWLRATVARPTSCGTNAQLDAVLSTIETQAEALAKTATPAINNLNWNTYPNGILYVIDALPCGWAGLGYIGFARAYTKGTASLGVVGHEFGHNFGLYHAGSVDCGASVIAASGCTVTEYGDPFVIMGNIQSGHFNVYQKGVLNYIPGGVATHSGGTATYTLGPIESAGQSLYGVKIPTSNSKRTYWVEFRQAIGFDSTIPGISALGAQVRLSLPFENNCSGCTGAYDDTQFLDMTPATSSFTDGALLAGQTFTDSSTGVTINVLSATAAALTVQISTGGGGPGATTTALASSANPSAPGQNVTFTASVTGTNPTGSVTFVDGGTTLCNAVALTGSGNTRTALCSSSSLAPGVHSITANYSGDASNALSASSPLSQTVIAATTTVLVSSQNPATAGANVTFTATVSGSAPTGPVAFTSDGGTIAGCSAVSLTGSGNSRTAACATNGLTAGTHAIVASYAGDSGNSASTSVTLTQTINGAAPGPTTTTLVSSQNPATAGVSVTFTATVTGTAPTGNVAFTSDGNTIAGCAAASLAGSGNSRTATCATNALTTGAHAIVATYAGNASNAASQSAALNQVVNAAGLASTKTTVTSARNPATTGATVALTATIVSGAQTVGGSVAFTANGNAIPGCASVPVVSAVGVRTAVCNATLPSGGYAVVGAYSGDAANQSSLSPVLTQVMAYPAIGNTVQFAVASTAVAETAGSAMLTVVRIGDTSAPASVNYATTPGSATAGADFTPTSGTLSWPAHDGTPRTIVVPIVNDAIADAGETFSVALSAPTGVALGANASTTVTLLDDEGAVVSMPGVATIVQNPYGTMSVTGGALNGNTISNLAKDAVIQLGGSAGGAGSTARIDFQGFDIGAGNTLTIRSGAAGQTVELVNVGGAAGITGILQAQGGGGAPAPVLMLRSANGVNVYAGGKVSGPSGLRVDTLGATSNVGSAFWNQGSVDGGPSLSVLAAEVHGGGRFAGNAATFATFGYLNNPVFGAHFVANGLQLFPSSGNNVAVVLAAYGGAPQVINLMVNGNATFSMPSQWPAGSTLPANNRPVMPGEVRAAGVPDPAYGGGSMILRATGNLALDGSASQDFVFPGSIVLIAGGAIDVHGTALDNGWTTAGTPFQGVFMEASSIGDSTGAPAIAVRTNNLNWANFSSRPALPVQTFTLQRQGNGSALFVAADGAAPHLNFYGIVTEAGAAGLCYSCLMNGQPVDFSVAP